MNKLFKPKQPFVVNYENTEARRLPKHNQASRQISQSSQSVAEELFVPSEKSRSKFSNDLAISSG